MKRKLIQCVNNDNKNGSPEETIYAIKLAGFDGVFVQWYNKDWKFSQQQQVDLCRRLGLDIQFAHLGYTGINNIWLEGAEGDELVENYLKDFDEMKKNDISLVVMHLSSKSVAPGPNEIGVKRFQKIVDYADSLNIKIAFENSKIPGYLEYMFDRIKNKNIGICFDSGHCHCHFNDEFNWKKFKNKIFCVHLHDNDASEDQHLLPFDGTIDWNDLFKKLETANYKGPVTLESAYARKYVEMELPNFYSESFKRANVIKNGMQPGAEPIVYQN